MKITLAIAIISIVRSAAITSACDDSITNDITENLENESVINAQSEESITEDIPNWLIEFKQYIDGENEIEFDLVNFLDNLEQNEVEDFFDLLVLMIDQELSVTEKNNLFDN